MLAGHITSHSIKHHLVHFGLIQHRFTVITQPLFVMKRTIRDFFAPSPDASKKVKSVEPTNEAHQICDVKPPETNTMDTTPASEQAVPNYHKQNTPPTATTQSSTLSSPDLLQTKKQIAADLASLVTDPSWKEALAPEFEKQYFLDLAYFVHNQRKSTVPIFPKEKDVFNALNFCPLDQVKVVIIGQDPYHQPDQAHGLCFSVLPPTKPPSSLRNIYKELADDIPGWTAPKHGNLETWAKQGILMLNAVLTVQFNAPNSHADKGWEKFTDACIGAISKKHKSIIFLLWGAFAQKKAKIADPKKHILLKAAHPSGLSASKGFFGCKHFSQVNQNLKQIGREPIDWTLPKEGTTGQYPSSSTSK